MPEMKTLTFDDVTYEVVDASARITADAALPKSGGTMTGALDVPAVGKDGYIAYPDGGCLSIESVVNGRLKITLPANGDTNTMLRFTIKIYSYYYSTSCDYVVCGFLSGGWVQNSALCMAPSGGLMSNLPVTFCKDGNKRYVLIGNADSTWTYAKIAVADVVLGGGNSSYNLWKSGWSVEVVNEDVPAGSATISNTNIMRSLTAADVGAAPTIHTHTKSQITDFPTSMPASDVSAWAKAATKPTYTASEVGADASGTAASAVSAHNDNPSAHTDIRNGISNALDVANSASANASYGIDVANSASANASYAISVAEGKASTATYTVSVPASWSANSAGGYMQTVTVSGILATDNPIADIILGSDVDANASYLEAWACVTRITTAANSITLYANGDAPATAFTCQLKAVR